MSSDGRHFRFWVHKKPCLSISIMATWADIEACSGGGLSIPVKWYEWSNCPTWAWAIKSTSSCGVRLAGCSSGDVISWGGFDLTCRLVSNFPSSRRLESLTALGDSVAEHSPFDNLGGSEYKGNRRLMHHNVPWRESAPLGMSPTVVIPCGDDTMNKPWVLCEFVATSIPRWGGRWGGSQAPLWN